jgi:mono/diheme cytochrome c family protein
MPRTALALLLALAACAHGGEGGASAPPDGAALYRRSCASCHRLKAPSEHDAATWKRAVERFGFRLRPDERDAIAAHLAAGASDAAPVR